MTSDRACLVWIVVALVVFVLLFTSARSLYVRGYSSGAGDAVVLFGDLAATRNATNFTAALGACLNDRVWFRTPRACELHDAAPPILNDPAGSGNAHASPATVTFSVVDGAHERVSVPMNFTNPCEGNGTVQITDPTSERGNYSLPMLYDFSLHGAYEVTEYCGNNSTPVFQQTYIVGT